MPDPKSVSPKLTRLATAMAWLSLAGAVLAVIAVLAIFLFPDVTQSLGVFRISHTGGDITGATPLSDRIIALGFAAIPTALGVWTLIALSRLFRLYAAGHVFSEDALRALTVVATTLFWRVIVEFAIQAPISYSCHTPIRRGTAQSR